MLAIPESHLRRGARLQTYVHYRSDQHLQPNCPVPLKLTLFSLLFILSYQTPFLSLSFLLMFVPMEPVMHKAFMPFLNDSLVL